MILYILNENYKKIDMLRQWTYCSYVQKATEIGTFEIHVRNTKQNKYLLEDDKQYYVLFDDRVFGKITNVNKTEETEENGEINILGSLALCILNDRVVKGTLNFSGKTHQYVKELVNRDIVNVSEAKRKMNISVRYDYQTEMNNKCSDIDKQVTGGYLWEEIQPVLEQDKLGIILQPNVSIDHNVQIDSQHIFTTNISSWTLSILKGTDRTKKNTAGNDPVVFSQSLSNIEKTEYVNNSKNYKNIAYVAGEGESAERKWYEIDKTEQFEYGFGRRELWIDARDIQSQDHNGNEISSTEYDKLIYQRADEKFAENEKQVTYDSTITRINKYRYGVDYQLCDWCTIVDNELGIEVDAQVTEVTRTITESDDITDVRFSYGTIDKDPIKQLQEIQQKISTIENHVKYVEQTKGSKFFPVGAVYISVVNENPKKYFGGTWELFGQGKTLIGVDSSDTDFNTSEKTGGSKTHTIAIDELPQHSHTVPAHRHGLNSHTHGVGTLTISEAGEHSHYAKYDKDAASGTAKTRYYPGGKTSSSDKFTTSDGKHKHTITGVSGAATGSTASSGQLASGNTGSGNSMSIIQPYVTVYFWKRTA